METDAPGPSKITKVEETIFEEAADEADYSPDEENVENIDIKVHELPNPLPSGVSNIIWPADGNDVVERRLYIDPVDNELNAAVLSLLADSRQQQREVPIVTSAVTSASSAMALQSQSVLQNGSNADEGLSLEEEERAFRRQALAVEEGGAAGAGAGAGARRCAVRLPSRHNGRTALRARNRLATSMPFQLAAFGRYVAEELESMSVEKAVEVKAEIMKVLLEAAAADL